jgi:hypothetical protein
MREQVKCTAAGGSRGHPACLGGRRACRDRLAMVAACVILHDRTLAAPDALSGPEALQALRVRER